MTLLVLPIIGFLLTNAFEKQLTSSIKNELSAYSYSILAVAEVEENQVFMPEQLAENQFNVIQSGLYASITQLSNNRLITRDNNTKTSNHLLWRSHSLLGINQPGRLPSPPVGKTLLSRIILENDVHFVFSFSVSFSQNFSQNKTEFPITIHIIKTLDDFELLVSQFQKQLWTWLVVLLLLLIVVQVFWLFFTLKPLRTLTGELQLVEQGESAKLEQNYPKELAQVTNQLNLLLQTEQSQRKRYRNALADLAHSLKNPLSVIQSQGELSQSSQQQITIINQMIEHQLKRAQSAGESSWYLGIQVNATLDKLLDSLEKIYRDKVLCFTKHCDKNAIFKGDEADLLEILGNLLDNACKAAISQVRVNIRMSEFALNIEVSDDGAGISVESVDKILKRGVRADTYQQGHGIGLAIVRDLVNSYQGELTIAKCKQLSGALFTLPFKKNN